MEFSYFMPVRLLFGANVIDQLGATAKSYGTHALIVTGRSSTKRSGLLDRSIALLEAAGVRATVFNKVEPNPLTTTVMEGAALAREQGCDLVIGMGGGSMMDAAKAVAFCAVNGGDVNDYISGGKQGTGCLPILEVPTTCGTGSEANPFAVLTNPETKDKKSLWGDLIYPKVSFIDPELMKTMPKEVLASVGFDALSHNMEGYLATRSQPITDQLALHAIRLTAGSLPKVYRGEGTQEDWENITLASLLGGKAETDCAEAVECFLKSIDLNCKLRELGVEESGIDWMTDNCINVFAGSMRNHTKALTRDEVKQIYLEAF